MDLPYLWKRWMRKVTNSILSFYLAYDWLVIDIDYISNIRYLNEHARQHYKETMHAYALELQTSRVWDYAGDG